MLLKEKSLKVGEKIAKERSEGLRKRRLSCNEKHLKSSKLMLNLIQRQPRFLHVSDSIVSSSRETAWFESHSKVLLCGCLQPKL